MPKDIGRRKRKKVKPIPRESEADTVDSKPDPKPEAKPEAKPEPINDYPEDPEEYYNDRAERWSGRTY